MNTECTIGREPGHCLCGMLTMGAKGQFGLHSSNCSRTQKLRELRTRWEPEADWHTHLPFAWHGNVGHWSTPFHSFLRRWSLLDCWGPLCALLSNLLFGVKILKAERRVLQREL